MKRRFFYPTFLLMVFVAAFFGQITAQAREVEIELFVEPQWTFDAVFDFRGGLAAVEYFTGMWGGYHDLGYINTAGEFVIAPVYRHAFAFYAYRGAPHFAYGTAGIMSLEDGGVAFFNAAGERLTDFVFTDARNFSEGLAAAQIGGNHWDFEWEEWQEQPAPRWGFVDVYGNVAIPFEFDYVADFSDGLAAVVRGNYMGFIDTEGNVVIPLEFVYARDGFMFVPVPSYFSDGFASIAFSNAEEPVFHGGSEPITNAIIDISGNIIHTFESNWHLPLIYGSVIVTDNNGNFIMDTSGNTMIRFERPNGLSSTNFSEGIVSFRYTRGNRQLWGFVNTMGDIIIPPTFAQTRQFSEGLAAVQVNNGLWGFVNAQGDMVIAPSFDEVRDFSEGFAAVMKLYDDQRFWGYIDTEGNIAVPLAFQQALNFSEGMAWVGVPNPRYDEILRDGDGFALRSIEWGLLRMVDYGTAAGFPMPPSPDFNLALDDDYTPEDEPETIIETPTHIPETSPAYEDTMPPTTTNATDETTSFNRNLIMAIVAVLVILGVFSIGMWQYRVKRKNA